MVLVRRVVGSSMEPLLHADQIVLVSRRARWTVGDVVVLRQAGLEKIKRITGQKSDTVYLEGDNSDASTDSRHFGWLPASLIQGKVIWPRHLSNPTYQK